MSRPEPDETARLYLVTPPLDGEIEAFCTKLETALDAADIASLLLRTKPGARASEAAIRAVGALVQPRGVALIVEGEPDLVLRSGADGLHVAACDTEEGERLLADALARLSPDYIVGAGGLSGKDDAMRAGEAGVDYVLFGEPGPDGRFPLAAETLDRTRWWAEIFNTPCVAFASGLAEVGPLSDAGADFVMLGEAVWDDPRGSADALRDAAARLAARTA